MESIADFDGFSRIVEESSRESAQIFTFAHKDVDYGFGDDSLRTSLEVGAACRSEHPHTKLRDDDGDNISLWNPVYSELTGQYWIAKHCNAEYIGQQQYRRRFPLDEDCDFAQIFEHYSAIACKPLHLGVSLEFQYKYCHGSKYIEACEKVLKKLHPSLADDYDKYIKGENKIYYSAGLCMPSLQYRKYSDFLFETLDATLLALDCHTPEDVRLMVENDIRHRLVPPSEGGMKGAVNYHSQVCAFLGERLMTLWLRHNFDGKILELPYNKMENQLI